MSSTNVKSRRPKPEGRTQTRLCVRCDAVETLRMWEMTASVIGVIWVLIGMTAPWLSFANSGSCSSSPVLVGLCGLGVISFLVGTVTTACGFHLHRAWPVLVLGSLGLSLVIAAVPIHHSIACDLAVPDWHSRMSSIVRMMYGIGGALMIAAAQHSLRSHTLTCRRCGGVRASGLVK